MKLRCLLLLLLCGLLPGVMPLSAQPLLPKPVNLEESLRKARVNGKYAMLLAQIEVPEDRAKYGEFADNGYSATSEWGGFKNLPAGHWVYVAPFWYIWRDVAPARRSWGPEQAVGEPDTNDLGDIQTAWASRAPDDQAEWLIAEFTTPVNATAVKIYESYNPGAIQKIVAFGLDGKETEIWAGQAAPTPNAAAVIVNQKPFPKPLKTNRVKIYIDSPSVPGYNEIDAIGLLEAGGRVQWASNVAASSTYAEQGGNVETGFLAPADPGLAQLQEQLRQMQNDIYELRQRAGLPPRPVILPNVDHFLGGPRIRRGGKRLDLGADNIVVFQEQPTLPGFPLVPGGAVPGEPPPAGPGRVEQPK